MIKSTLVHHYLKNVTEHPKQIIYRFIDGDKTDSQNLNQSYTKASSIAKNLLQNAKRGDRALLLYMPGINFLDAFWACQLAGIIAVPVPLTPNLKQVAKFIHHTSKKCEPAVLLTTASLQNSVEAFASSGDIYHPKKIIATDMVAVSSIDESTFVLPTDDTVALLQYTSGSVSQPKGVIISHQNFKSNLNIIIKNTGIAEMTNGSGWLPHFHDMGLIGQFLIPVVVPGPFNFMSPLSFIESPQKWLQTLSDYKSEITVAPNFAFEYCNKKIDVDKLFAIDLSNLHVILTGSEPIKADTLRTFAQKFEPLNFNVNAFMPCYGMAESTLMISCHKKLSPFKTKQLSKKALHENKLIKGFGADATELTSCGKVDDSFSVKIVNKHNQPVENTIGEIWLKGPSISKGYWNENNLASESFNAYLNNGDGPYLKTGDLGCLIDNEIYITGRLKDIIIVRGKNYYPQDVEDVARLAHKNIKKGSVVTFGYKNKLQQEAVAVCFEAKNKMDEAAFDATAKKIVANVLDECGIRVEEICLVNDRKIPKTSSGKIQRTMAKKLWQKNELGVINTYAVKTNNKAFDTKKIRATIVKEIMAFSGALTLNKIDDNQRIFDFGVESIQLPQLLMNLKTKTGLTINLEKFMNEPSINGLLNALENKNTQDFILNNRNEKTATIKNAVVLPDFNLLN